MYLIRIGLKLEVRRERQSEMRTDENDIKLMSVFDDEALHNPH